MSKTKKYLILAVVGLIITFCAPTQTVKTPVGTELTAENKLKAEQEYSIGYEYLKQSKYDDAILHFQEAIKLWSKYYAAYIALGQAYRVKRDVVLAESSYNQAKRIDPRDTRAYEGLATIYFVDYKKYGEAIAEYESALVLDSNNVDILNGLGAIYTKLKDYNKALQYYLKSLKYESENLTTIYAVANLYTEMKQPDIAIKYLEVLKAKKPEAMEVRELLAKVFLNLERYNDAAQEYTFLLSKKPDNSYYHLQLGLIYMKQKKFTNAQKEFEEAKRLTPDDASPWLYLADLNIARGRLNEAEGIVREAMKLAPDNMYSYVLLGDIYERRGFQTKSAWEKSKTRENKNTGISAVNLLNQAITYYSRARADQQFSSYAATEIERCNNWIRQVKEELWYIGVKL